MDLRERVVAACDSGSWKREEIAERFGVSTAWIRRLLQRRRETGNYAPKQTKRGRKPAFSGEVLDRLDRLAGNQKPEKPGTDTEFPVGGPAKRG